MKNVDFILGGYKPLNTPLHRMDARIKIIALIVLMVILFIPYGNSAESSYPYAMSMLMGGAIAVFILILAGIGRISPLRMLSSLKSIIPLLVIVALLDIFFYHPNADFLNQKVLFKIGSGWPIYESSLWFTGYVLERIVVTILGTMTIVSATKPMDISYAVEWYLKPLELVKVPVKAFSMLTSLALRFIPVLSEQAQRIQKAQAARGLDSRNGTLAVKFKSLAGLMLPLLLLSCQDAIQVAEAMEARGYDPRGKRTRYRSQKASGADFGWLFLFALILAGCLFLCLYRSNGLRIDLFM